MSANQQSYLLLHTIASIGCALYVIGHSKWHVWNQNKWSTWVSGCITPSLEILFEFFLCKLKWNGLSLQSHIKFRVPGFSYKLWYMRLFNKMDNIGIHPSGRKTPFEDHHKLFSFSKIKQYIVLPTWCCKNKNCVKLYRLK